MRISSHKRNRKYDVMINKYLKKNVFCGAGIVLIMTVVQFTAQEIPDIYYGTQLQPVNMR